MRDAGFEVGVHCYDHIAWQDFVVRRDYAWTERQMRLAVERFTAVFEPLVMLFMGVLLGGLILSMLLAIMSINDVAV